MMCSLNSTIQKENYDMNGMAWSKITENAPMLVSVAYGGGRYAGVDNEGKIHTSDNAADWSSVPPITQNKLHAITYGNSQFIAVGDYGTILGSKLESPLPVNRYSKKEVNTKFVFTNNKVAIKIPPGYFSKRPLNFKILDIAGRIVYVKTFTKHNNTFSISSLGIAAGIYYAEVSDSHRKMRAPLTLIR